MYLIAVLVEPLHVRASLCLHFTFGSACCRYLLVTVLSLNRCVDHINCTCKLLSSLDEYHHTCMVIVPFVFIESIHRQSWSKTRPFVGGRMPAIAKKPKKITLFGDDITSTVLERCLL